MIIDIQDAEAHLSRLVHRALSGEEIIVARAGEPMVRLTPIRPRSEPRILGSWTGKVQVADHFDAPLPDTLLDAFIHGPIEPKKNQLRQGDFS